MNDRKRVALEGRGVRGGTWRIIMENYNQDTLHEKRNYVQLKEKNENEG